MVKTLENVLLQNQETFGAESWYIAWKTQTLSNCSNDDHMSTFDIYKYAGERILTHGFMVFNFLLLCRFVVYSTRRFVLCLKLCYFVFVFSVLLALRLPRLGKRELILALFVHLFDLRVFGFVCFLFVLVSRNGCDL